MIWGLVHMLAGLLTISRGTSEAVQGIADAPEPSTLEMNYPDAVGAIINQHGFNLLSSTAFAVTYNIPRVGSRLGPDVRSVTLTEAEALALHTIAGNLTRRADLVEVLGFPSPRLGTCWHVYAIVV